MKAWVISGGGARIVQAQVLIEKYIAEGGSLPDMIVGTSAGGLLAFLLSHLGVEGAREEIFAIKRRQDVFRGHLFWSLGQGKEGFWHSKPMEQIMERVQRRSKPTIPAWVCSYDIVRQRKLYFPIAKNSAATLASTACIPVLVEPKDTFVDGEPIKSMLVDGGVAENTPLKFAIDQGCDEIEVFQCSAEGERLPDIVNGKLDMVIKCLEAQRIEIAKDDLKVCSLKNKIGAKPINARMYSPIQNHLELLAFDDMRKAYSLSMADKAVKIVTLE